jgi:hypothetical protein
LAFVLALSIMIRSDKRRAEQVIGADRPIASLYMAYVSRYRCALIASHAYDRPVAHFSAAPLT